MSRLLFNSIVIVICILSIVSIAIILPHEYKKSVNRFNTVIQITAIILAAGIFTFMILSLDYTGMPCVSGQIVEVKTLGSFAGIYDRYKIVVLDDNGIRHELQSIFPVYSNLAETLDHISAGDYCELFGSTILDTFFYSISLVK